MMERVFFDLICFGKWKLVEAYEDQVTIESGDRQLFDLDSEEWIPAPSTKIVLRRNKRYKIIEGGYLSYYDREVFEVNGYYQQ